MTVFAEQPFRVRLDPTHHGIEADCHRTVGLVAQNGAHCRRGCDHDRYESDRRVAQEAKTTL